MLDKIRLAAAGKLPEAWQAARGTSSKNSFDSRTCIFLHIDYAALEAETLKGDKSDEQLLEWAFAQGRQPSEDEVEVWNGFMSKRAGAMPVRSVLTSVLPRSACCRTQWRPCLNTLIWMKAGSNRARNDVGQ